MSTSDFVAELLPHNKYIKPIEIEINGKLVQAQCTSGRIVKKLPKNWRCPACARTLGECVFYNGRRKAWWLSVHAHHDHSGHSRFPRTLICGCCNGVDGDVKIYWRREKLHKYNWSFAPAEIGKLIWIEPNRQHRIDYNKSRKAAWLLVEMLDLKERPDKI